MSIGTLVTAGAVTCQNKSGGSNKKLDSHQVTQLPTDTVHGFTDYDFLFTVSLALNLRPSKDLCLWVMSPEVNQQVDEFMPLKTFGLNDMAVSELRQTAITARASRSLICRILDDDIFNISHFI
jgi:hypothetical protein